MVPACIIIPGLPLEMMYRPAEEVCTYLSSQRESHFTECTIDSDSDYVKHIGLHKYQDQVGDTATIFIKGSTVFKMVFIDFDSEDRPEYNLFASILHSRGQKIWGPALITAVDKTTKELVGCCVEDVLNILYRRAWHTGIHFNPGKASPREVEISNCWITRDERQCIATWKKERYTDQDGNSMLRVGSKDGEHYVFAMLDDTMLLDLTLDAAAPDA